jgi:hypothetical protein
MTRPAHYGKWGQRAAERRAYLPHTLELDLPIG